MTKMVIKRVDVFSVAKWMGVFTAVFVLSSIAVFSLFFRLSTMGVLPALSFDQAAAAPNGFVSIIVLVTFVYGATGFVSGFIGAFLYNALAGKSLGAIQVELDTMPTDYRSSE